MDTGLKLYQLENKGKGRTIYENSGHSGAGDPYAGDS